jgi:PKD repeat protein
VGLAATSNRIYRLTGAISQPIVLSALDMETGITLYESFPLPGDPDQENPIALGPENRIYFWRDGGNFYAYEDVGNAVVPVWSYVPQTTTGSSLTGNISVGPDSTVYIFDDDRIKRLSHATGQVINTSLALFNQGFISIGSDGTVYANTQLGTYYAFTPDLQTVKWQYGFGANTYNNMSLSKDGIMVLTAAGNQITALQTPNLMKPVADFFVSNRVVSVGQQIDFFDQSSFAPTSWTWSFPGANFTSSGVTNPSGISYSSAGIYPVQLTVANAFGSDSLVKSCYIEVLGTASMTETADDFWSIWPNPSEGVFQLQINHDVQRGRVVVMDMTGREVRSVEHDAATMTLDFSDLKNGLYILRFGQNLEYASVLVKH